MLKMGKQNVIVTLLGCCVFCGLYYSQQNIHCSSPMSKKDESAEQYSTPFLSPTPTSRRKGPLPYKCGIVWFYHIPSTGGSSINRWLRKYQKPANGNITYYQSWKVAVTGGKFLPDPEMYEKKYNKGMETYIQNLGPNEWRIAHSHLTNNYLNESDDILNLWRTTVESQGCQLINTVMLRDPLNHAMSLHKVMKSKNSTRDEWTEHLKTPTGLGKWHTVLDFFLYNNQFLRNHPDYPNPWGRNPFNVTKHEKVRRAMEILNQHFDVVSIADHAQYKHDILEMTGWIDMEIPHSNV
eukprot:g12428.t1.1.5e17418b g12428  g12428.t1 contig6:1907780-1908830(+)